jgi:hypothetical protein
MRIYLLVVWVVVNLGSGFVNPLFYLSEIDNIRRRFDRHSIYRIATDHKCGVKLQKHSNHIAARTEIRKNGQDTREANRAEQILLKLRTRCTKKSQGYGRKIMKKDFKKIALSLGIVIPASLLPIGNANATSARTTLPNNNPLIEQLVGKKNSNEVINRIYILGKETENDNFFTYHSNNHTNSNGNHTNQHSNTYHSDYHTNREGYSTEYACVVHTNNHSNTPGSNSHTDYTSDHTNSHTDNPNC